MARKLVCYRPKKPLIDAYTKEHGFQKLYEFFVIDEEGFPKGVLPECPPDLRAEMIDFFLGGRDIFADKPAANPTDHS